MSVICPDKIEESKIHVSNVDVVDDTPLLDIKPYIPNFDKCKSEKLHIGWFEDKHGNANHKKSNDRFVN
jgi:tRNA (adenine37-N6)-methyltransferase